MVAGLLLMLFTSWTGLFWSAVALALYEVLVTVVAGAAHEGTGESPSEQPSGSAQRGGTVSTA